MKDDLVGALGVTADKDGYIDSEGNYQQRTCFTKGTLVESKSGYSAIEEIKIGEEVYSFNEVTQKKELKKVTQLYVNEVKVLFELTLADNSKVLTTWNHPFYVVEEKSKASTELTGGWVEAKDLKPNTLLYSSIGKNLPLQSVKEIILEKPVTVYNIEVEDNHTYFVGQNSVLVHNYLALAAGGVIAAVRGLAIAGQACMAHDGCNAKLQELTNKAKELVGLGNDDKVANKPARDTSVTQKEADDMRKQGLDPINKGDIADYKKSSDGKQVTQNKKDGVRREQETKQELEKKYPGASVQSEHYLRDKNGNIAKDPLSNTGRRIDFMVIKNGKVIDSVETTSKNADKIQQTRKEERIRNNGGNYIKDKETGKIIDLGNQKTRLDRRS